MSEFRKDGSHTGGVIIKGGIVYKPLVGRKWYYKVVPKTLEERMRDLRAGKELESIETFKEYPTLEYEVIKALEDLPHVPKNVEKIMIDGKPHLKRENYRIFEDVDYKELGIEQLMSIKKTIEEANKRGWMVSDDIQLAYNKQNEVVIYDWSNARTPETWVALGNHIGDFGDASLLRRLWRRVGREEEIKNIKFEYYEHVIGKPNKPNTKIRSI